MQSHGRIVRRGGRRSNTHAHAKQHSLSLPKSLLEHVFSNLNNESRYAVTQRVTIVITSLPSAACRTVCKEWQAVIDDCLDSIVVRDPDQLVDARAFTRRVHRATALHLGGWSATSPLPKFLVCNARMQSALRTMLPPNLQSLSIHTTGFVTGLADALRSTVNTLEVCGYIVSMHGEYPLHEYHLVTQVFCLPRPAQQWLQLASELPVLTTLLLFIDDDEDDACNIALPPPLLQRGALHALTLHNLSDGLVEVDDSLSQLQRLTLLDVQRVTTLPPATRLVLFAVVCLMRICCIC